MKLVPTLKTLFPALLFLLGTIPAIGQEKFSIAAGLGNPELLNVGVRYQMGQSQISLSAGTWFGGYEAEYDLSFGADYFYHFGGSSSLSTRRPWYGRLGLYFYSSDGMYNNFKYLLLAPRIGKEFNLSPKVGMAADLGVSQVLSRIDEDPVYIDELNDTSLSIGFSIFYRL